MAEIFNFYVHDNRSIQFPKANLLEPIMQEDHNVAVWRFRIPKVLNNIDMSSWAWWFVYVNANGQEYSEPLTLVDDIDEPDSYSTADHSIDYGVSYYPGNFSFSLEAINANTGGTVLNEWHTKSYSHKVDRTLQGNHAQWAESESDIISALITEYQTKIRNLVGGATPPTSDTVAGFDADESPIWVYTGSEEEYVFGNWYYYNGSAWTSGGVYASGIVVDSVPTQGSNNAVSSGGVYSEFEDADRRIGAVSDYNVIDILRTYGAHEDITHNGVTFTWDGDVCTVSGTASGDAARCNLIASTSVIPSYLQAGKSYRVDIESTDANIKLQIVYYTGSSTSSVSLSADSIINIPSTATGIVIRLQVAKNATASGTIKAALRNLPTLRDTVNHILQDSVYANNLLYIYGTRIDARSNGVGFLWDGNVCYVSGTASSGTFNNILSSTSALPICFQAGKTYKVKCHTTDDKIKLRFQWYKNGAAGTNVNLTSDAEVTIPDDVTGMIIRIFVASGDTVDGAIHFSIDGKAVEAIDLLRANVASGYISVKPNKIRDYDYTSGASNTYYVTDYIPVQENRGICITGYELSNKLLCAYFDADYKPIKADRIEASAQDIAEHHGKTPYGCRYIRFHLLASQINTFNVFYTNYDDSPSENVIYPYIFNRRLFQAIADIPPMCAVIDDDTSGLGYVTKFHDKCVENEIVGNYAVITKYLDQSQTLAETLLGYEAEGFGMLYHCEEQLEIYRDTSSPNRDMAAAEVNFCTGLRKMRTYGFLDYNYWIIPYGTLDDEMRALAQRHGMQCCFGAANSSYVTTTKRVDRWSIPRCGLIDTDASVTTVKGLLDDCYAEHGMFYLMTHFNSGWDITGDMDRFDEVIQYAKNLGYKFVTVPEAMRYWMPVYRINEML